MAVTGTSSTDNKNSLMTKVELGISRVDTLTIEWSEWRRFGDGKGCVYSGLACRIIHLNTLM